MYLRPFVNQARIYQTLAHPKRLEIINLLREGPLKVTDIYAMLDLPQANISQHLSVLRQAGVVKTKREGKEIYYQISRQRIIKAYDLFCPKKMSLKKLGPLVHDPVCGMQLSAKAAFFRCRYKNKTYHFCASGCLKKFKARPGKYV